MFLLFFMEPKLLENSYRLIFRGSSLTGLFGAQPFNSPLPRGFYREC